MRLGRRLKNKPWVQKAVGTLAAEYLRFVWMTSRFTMEPAEPFLLYEAQQPVIIAMWHGQHFLLPFLRRQYRIQGVDLPAQRRRDQCSRRRAARRRHGSRFGRSWDQVQHQRRRRRIQRHAGIARTRLEHGINRRRAEGFSCRRPWHHQARARVRADRSFLSAWRPVAGSCSTIGIAPKSTCRSAVAGLSSANRSAFLRMRTPLCCNKLVRCSKKRSVQRPNVLTRLPTGGLERPRDCRSGL